MAIPRGRVEDCFEHKRDISKDLQIGWLASELELKFENLARNLSRSYLQNHQRRLAHGRIADGLSGCRVSDYSKRERGRGLSF